MTDWTCNTIAMHEEAAHWHSLLYHPHTHPFFLFSPLTQHAQPSGHGVTVPTSLFGNCMDSTPSAGLLADAHKMWLNNHPTKPNNYSTLPLPIPCIENSLFLITHTTIANMNYANHLCKAFLLLQAAMALLPCNLHHASISSDKREYSASVPMIQQVDALPHVIEPTSVCIINTTPEQCSQSDIENWTVTKRQDHRLPNKFMRASKCLLSILVNPQCSRHQEQGIPQCSFCKTTPKNEKWSMSYNIKNIG